MYTHTYVSPSLRNTLRCFLHGFLQPEESAADIMTVSTRSRMLSNMQMRRPRPHFAVWLCICMAFKCLSDIHVMDPCHGSVSWICVQMHQPLAELGRSFLVFISLFLSLRGPLGFYAFLESLHFPLKTLALCKGWTISALSTLAVKSHLGLGRKSVRRIGRMFWTLTLQMVDSFSW